MLKRFYLILFTILTVAFFADGAMPALAAGNFAITGINIDNASSILVLSGKDNQSAVSFKPQPIVSQDKLSVDLYNTTLNTPKSSLSIQSPSIKTINLSQISLKPAVTRLTITGNSSAVAPVLSFSKSKNIIIFKVADIKSPIKNLATIYDENGKVAQEDMANGLIPMVSHSYTINTVRQVNDHLSISGIGNVTLKEPIFLSNPNRVVYDLPDTALVSRDLAQTVKLSSTDSVRLAQFDPQTVRLVIETPTPDDYRTIVSPDAQSLIIANSSKTRLTNLSDSRGTGQVKDISVTRKDPQTSILSIHTSRPIIHNIRKDYTNNKIILDLYNINAPSKKEIVGLAKTLQIKGVNIESIQKYPKGASWKIAIANDAWIQSKLSSDAQHLNIIVKSAVVNVSRTTATASPTRNAGQKQVVIDPGHGGTEPGAQRAGIYEKHINLSVAQKVRRILTQAGINVIMTRTDDATLSLKERTIITNNEAPDAFVSIHVNSCESPGVTGLETHWYTPQSRSLAQIIQKKLISAPIQSPDRGIMNSMFYVIHHTNVPAVLVEIGFISNENERNQLLTDSRQESTARAISDGIIEFLNRKKD